MKVIKCNDNLRNEENLKIEDDLKNKDDLIDKIKTVRYEEVAKITHCVIYHIVCYNFEKGDIMSVHQYPLVVACMCTLFAHCVPILWCTLVWIKASLRYLITSPRRKTVPKMETK